MTNNLADITYPKMVYFLPIKLHYTFSYHDTFSYDKQDDRTTAQFVAPGTHHTTSGIGAGVRWTTVCNVWIW